MAAYATVDDLTLIGLPAKNVTSVQSADAVEAALESASRFADSYLTSRYVLPLVQWDGALTQAVASIAAFNIMRARGFAPGVQDAETLRIGYDYAVDWLKNVSKGMATLSGATNADSASPQVGESSSAGVVQGGAGNVFQLSRPTRGW